MAAPPGLDKVAHFFGFLASAWVWQGWARRRELGAPALATFAFATAYSALLELAQGVFTDTRAADPLDLAASALGAAVGVVLGHLRAR
jgi:VanZ family protein